MSLFYKQKLRVCSKVKIIDTESQNASQNAALLGDENCIELRDRSHLCYKSIINYDLDITYILVVAPQIRYIEVFDITNPQFNEQIWPIPGDFVKSSFHCTSNLRRQLRVRGNRGRKWGGKQDGVQTCDNTNDSNEGKEDFR